MSILCDTSSVLMLIRIVPNMFIDVCYECFTTPSVRNEIFRTQKFKTRYPWREEFKSEITCLCSDLVENRKVSAYFDAIKTLIDNGTVNEKTGCDFDLSRTDMKFLSCALGNGYKITTGDCDLRTFGKQEFGKEFKGWISPLGMLNRWLRRGSIEWNDERHGYLMDWNRCNEDPQPRKQRSEFRRLTGLSYPGS